MTNQLIPYNNEIELIENQDNNITEKGMTKIVKSFAKYSIDDEYENVDLHPKISTEMVDKIFYSIYSKMNINKNNKFIRAYHRYPFEALYKFNSKLEYHFIGGINVC